jgi:hypothetical protein
MLLYSRNAEFKCIRTLCSKNVNNRVKDFMLSKVDDSYFHFPPCKSAFVRLSKMIRKRGAYIEFDDLLEDPNIELDYRDSLADSPRRVCKTRKSVLHTTEILVEHRKARIMYSTAKHVVNSLKEDKLPDMDDMLDKVATDVNVARASMAEEQKVWNLGHRSNISSLVERVLDGEGPELWKTGFSKFDNINGGLPKEGVHIMAATTSGGKTALARQLMRNMYFLNKISVCALSLEMYEEQELRRTLCALSRVPHDKFLKKTLDSSDRRAVKRALRKFEDFGEKYEARYSFVTPTIGLTIEQALLMMRPYGFNVIVLDYISLLEGTQGDKQWQQLSEIVRQCKIFSKQHKVLVVVLAQLDNEDDRIRYSKGIIEHADNYWHWNYADPKQRESKILPVKQGKARDQQLFQFDLREEFEYMTVRDIEEEELNLDYTDSTTEIDDSTGVS